MRAGTGDAAVALLLLLDPGASVIDQRPKHIFLRSLYDARVLVPWIFTVCKH